MLEKGQDPFEGFSKEQYNEARQTIVACILGTGDTCRCFHDGYREIIKSMRKDVTLEKVHSEFGIRCQFPFAQPMIRFHL